MSIPICRLVFACLRSPLNSDWFRFACNLSSRLFPFPASDLSNFYLFTVLLNFTIASDVKSTNTAPVDALTTSHATFDLVCS